MRRSVFAVIPSFASPPMKLLLTLGFASTLAMASSPAQEWTRFRGPNGTGISDAKTVPVAWTEKDYNWKVELPAGGNASPVLWEHKIFLPVADESQFSVVCIDDRDGHQIWKRDYPHAYYHLHKFNSFASGSCAVDEDRVYFTRQDGREMFLCALTQAGEPVWQVSLGEFEAQHGGGQSPIVYQDLVVVPNDEDLAGEILAVDRKTGKKRWSIPRHPGTADYAVPCVFTQAGKPPLLIFNSHDDGVSAVDPLTGRVAWSTADDLLKLRCVSSPFVAAGMTFATCGVAGGGNYVVAVQPPTDGSTKAEMQYAIRKAAPYVPTPIAYNGRLFLWGDGGIVTCADATTGKTKWQERVGGNYFSSPVCVDGKIYGTSDSGDVVVIAAGDEFKVLARNDLGELTRATPAVANGRIVFRTWEHLIRIGGKDSATVN
ncbi:PQQ-binding-like beta-propeller repeat protein [bacterium]|nr:PQQ-binding-like beta-propeller repeat protein [bacterium]